MTAFALPPAARTAMRSGSPPWWGVREARVLAAGVGANVRGVARWLFTAEQPGDHGAASAPARRWAPGAPVSEAPAPLPDDDHRLLARAVDGDRDAFADLYDRHARAVFGLLVRLVGDRQVAEELVQETFLRVWQHAPTFDARRGAPLPWVLGIAHNLGLNEHRRRRSRPVVSPPAGDELVDPRIERIAGAEPDPADEAVRRDRLATVAAALDALPGPQRDVIRLYAVGHTQEEIALALDAPLGTVKTRMRRGLLRLRDALREPGVES